MGKVACQRIAIGKGVCGTVAASGKSEVVPDVEAWPGHIACDGDTKSEIVVPILVGGRVRFRRLNACLLYSSRRVVCEM